MASRPVALLLHPARPPHGDTTPAPFTVFADGTIGNQMLANGLPASLIGFPTRLLGFQSDPVSGVAIEVDVEAFFADPDAAVGLFPVFVDAEGTASSFLLEVSSVEPVE